MLNFRTRPDPSSAVVHREPPAAEGGGAVIEATGESGWHGAETWWQVLVEDRLAWANARFLAVPGRTYSLGHSLNGLISDAGFPLSELADDVAEQRFGSSVTRVVEIDAFGDDAQTSQAWFDVIGTPVDVRGERIHLVLRNLLDDEPRVVGFEVIAAEGTVLCDAAKPTSGTCDLPVDDAPPG